jgi:hypothetical protein
MAISFEDHIKSFKTLESKTKLDMPADAVPLKDAAMIIPKIDKVLPRMASAVINIIVDTIKNDDFGIKDIDQANKLFENLEKKISDAIEQIGNDLKDKQQEIETKLEKYEHIKGNYTVNELRDKKHENYKDFDKATWDVSHTSLNYLELQAKKEELEKQLKKLQDFKADDPSLRDMQKHFADFANNFKLANTKELSSIEKTKKNHALSNFDEDIITTGGDKAIEILGATVGFIASGVKKIHSATKWFDNGSYDLAEGIVESTVDYFKPDPTPSNNKNNSKSIEK